MKSRTSNKSAPGGKSPEVRPQQPGLTQRVWPRYSDIGLQRRVMAYAFIGMTALAAIYAFVALDAVDKSTDFWRFPAGELIAEDIVDGKSSSIDISSLNLDRFEKGALLSGSYAGNQA